MAFHLIAITGLNAVGDTFQFGFGVEDSTGTTQDVANAVADSFTQRFTSTHGGGTLKAQFAPNTSFLKVSAYRRSKTPGGPADELAETALTGLVGGGVPNPLPPEVAVCVSLLTGAPGRSNRGRMYLPAPHANAMDGVGKMTAAAQDVFVAWAAAFFGDVNTAARTSVLWSRKNALSRAITSVSVGNQFDVQRRRQNSTPEAFSTVAVSQI